MKYGIGINGSREPKKLTRLRSGYPISGAIGKNSVKSTNHSFVKHYLTIKYYNHFLKTWPSFMAWQIVKVVF